MILNHPLGVLFSEGFLADLDYLLLVKTSLRARNELGTSLEHRIVNTFLDTVLQG